LESSRRHDLGTWSVSLVRGGSPASGAVPARAAGDRRPVHPGRDGLQQGSGQMRVPLPQDRAGGRRSDGASQSPQPKAVQFAFVDRLLQATERAQTLRGSTATDDAAGEVFGHVLAPVRAPRAGSGCPLGWLTRLTAWGGSGWVGQAACRWWVLPRSCQIDRCREHDATVGGLPPTRPHPALRVWTASAQADRSPPSSSACTRPDRTCCRTRRGLSATSVAPG
jgi:hypothetical protein